MNPFFLSALLLILPATVFGQQRDPTFGTNFDNGTFRGRTINFNNYIYIRVLQQSGGFAVVRQNCTAQGSCQQTKMIIIRLNSLVETGTNGQEVGLRSATPHSFASFEQQQFDVVTRQGVFVPYSNVTADSIRLQTTLPGLSASTGISINIYVVRDYGLINITNEVQYLVPGMVKFTFNVTRWDFCGCALYPFINSVPSQSPLTNVELGTYLDLYFEVQSPVTPQQRFNNPNMPRVYGLDSSTGSIALSSRVVLDDVTYTMDPNYPLFKNVGNKQAFVVRFNRFNRSAYYDPTLTVSDDIDNGGLLVTGLVTVIITGLLTALTCVNM